MAWNLKGKGGSGDAGSDSVGLVCIGNKGGGWAAGSGWGGLPLNVELPEE